MALQCLLLPVQLWRPIHWPYVCHMAKAFGRVKKLSGCGGGGREEGLRTGHIRCFKINKTVVLEVTCVQFQPGSGSGFWKRAISHFSIN